MKKNKLFSLLSTYLETGELREILHLLGMSGKDLYDNQYALVCYAFPHVELLSKREFTLKNGSQIQGLEQDSIDCTQYKNDLLDIFQRTDEEVPSDDHMKQLEVTTPISMHDFCFQTSLPKNFIQEILGQIVVIEKEHLVKIEPALRKKYNTTLSITEGTTLPRPSIVTVLGHVDHGKTTLISRIKEAQFSREEGGITQQVAVYPVTHAGTESRPCHFIFIDTPGHNAFSKMRSLGSRICDIVVLVISAIDGIQEQTIESIEYINLHKLTTLVVLTKTDIVPNREAQIIGDLASHGILAEEIGGKIPCIRLSLKDDIQDVVSLLSLQSSLLQLHYSPYHTATGYVLENTVNRRMGLGSLVILKEGKLRVGDYVMMGDEVSRIRIIQDIYGHNKEEGTPLYPFMMYGSNKSVTDTIIMRQLSSQESKALLKQKRKPTQTTSWQDTEHYINVMTYADTDGKLHALNKSVQDNFGSKVFIRKSSIGDYGSFDLQMGEESDAIILSYNIPIPQTTSCAVIQGTVIYKIIEQLEQEIQIREKKLYESCVIARISIIAVFNIAGSKIGGGQVIKGTIKIGDQVVINECLEKTAIVKSIRVRAKQVDQAYPGQDYGFLFENHYEPQIGDKLDIVDKK